MPDTRRTLADPSPLMVRIHTPRSCPPQLSPPSLSPPEDATTAEGGREGEAFPRPSPAPALREPLNLVRVCTFKPGVCLYAQAAPVFFIALVK